ncbi:hypothetical protein BDZ89DRAFT_941468 [Hymenopellis radicata]|nr:hypothetical protein BDZ89DRAFT_941468 [Hymenopellis radicata]
MRISVHQRKGPPVSRSVRRRQFPVTLAYAFTDYLSAQGQTIVPVIIDIATPPGGALIFIHSPELLQEDDRLERMNKGTTDWWEKVEVHHE